MKQTRLHWCDGWANEKGVGFNAHCLSLVTSETVGETRKFEVQPHQNIGTTKTKDVGFNAYCLSLVNYETVWETGKIKVQHHQKIGTTKSLPCTKALIKQYRSVCINCLWTVAKCPVWSTPSLEIPYADKIPMEIWYQIHFFMQGDEFQPWRDLKVGGYACMPCWKVYLQLWDVRP